MSAKKTGLGRGFASLIPTELLDESFDPTASQDEQVSDLRAIKLSEIMPDPEQPRRYFDEDAIQDLAASLAEHGVLQPIVVTPIDGGGYQIVAGERRYRAAHIAKLDKIPAIVRTLSNQHKLELSLIENLQRRDLNVMETATAYLKLRDQFNLTLDEISRRIGGRSLSAISNTLRLLRLPENVRRAIVEGKLTEGQARPLINADSELINAILPRIIKEEWSARKVEQFIVDVKRGAVAPKNSSSLNADSSRHEQRTKTLSGRLQTSVTIRANTKGAGTIVIQFKNDKDLERLEKLLGS